MRRLWNGVLLLAVAAAYGLWFGVRLLLLPGQWLWRRWHHRER